VTSLSDVSAGGMDASSARHPAYPLEQVARSRSTRFQIGFARMTMHLLPRFENVLLEASEKGLRIYAASELALALPGEVMRRIHADDVDISEPQARLSYGTVVQEPIMWMRAAVPRTYCEPVVHHLIARGAAIDEVDWRAHSPVVRAKAPLRQLLGYPQSLEVLTGGAAQLEMGLSHYAPVPPEPGAAA